ncbi:MAG TPA: cupin domain-containing protein [Exilispira sp.]|jgi:quercetin dioxygenase-like cupin family protein|nr:cupin domain-containing protein [Caldisericia bacterium]HQJ41290.1 cupin domain-containing protein [Exilispira sp.]HQM89866.1 cupin domain-containing protein [Exilispira sp.]HQQ20068.1 cupin domain-containing protein [Exilispira sp.]
MEIYTKSTDSIAFEPLTNEGAKDAEIKVVIGKEQGAPNFIMRIFRIAKNGHTPVHSHEWEHENYILKGSGELRNSKGESKQIKQGDVVLIPPFEEHQFYNSGNEELVFICLIPIMDRV